MTQEFLSLEWMFNRAHWRQRLGARMASVAKGSAALAVSKIVSMVVPFLTVPWTLAYLGNERFGIWMAAASFICLLSLAEGGVANTLVTATARVHARGEADTIRRLIGSAYMLLVPLAALMILAGLIIVPAISWDKLFNIKNSVGATEAPAVVLVIIITTAVAFVVNVVIKVRMGLQEIPQVSFWEVLAALSCMPSLLLAIHLKLGTPWLVAAMVGVQTLVKGIGTAVFLFRNPEYRPSIIDADWKCALDLLRSGSMFFIVMMAHAVAVSSDQFLIATFVSAEAVAPYTLVHRLFSIPYLLTSLVYFAQWPVYAEAMAKGDLDWIRRSFARTLLWTFSFALVFSLVLLFFHEIVLELWLGEELNPPSTIVFGMAIFAVLTVVESACQTLLFSLDARREQIVLSLAMMLVNLPLTVALLRWIGAPGAIIATDLAYLACLIIPYAFIIRGRLWHPEKEWRADGRADARSTRPHVLSDAAAPGAQTVE